MHEYIDFACITVSCYLFLWRILSNLELCENCKKENQTTAKDVYKSYTEYCDNRNIRALDNQTFGTYIKKLWGVTKHSTRYPPNWSVDMPVAAHICMCRVGCNLSTIFFRIVVFPVPACPHNKTLCPFRHKSITVSIMSQSSKTIVFRENL